MEVTITSVMARSPFFDFFMLPQRVAIRATTTDAAATMMAVTMNSMVVLLSLFFAGFLCPPSTPLQYHNPPHIWAGCHF
ncbi:MAG: hypothetical protein IJT44_05825 [Clostridia bacterium]|nr:hypothetical protein [Clostridia bacterium]